MQVLGLLHTHHATYIFFWVREFCRLPVHENKFTFPYIHETIVFLAFESAIYMALGRLDRVVMNGSWSVLESSFVDTNGPADIGCP